MTAVTAAPSDEIVEEPEKKPDLEVILPEPGKVTIDGVECTVRHLKAREFFMLMRVLTQGVGPNLMQIRFQGKTDEDMAGMVTGILLMAIPEALDDFMDLVQHLVEPVDVANRSKVKAALENPEIEELLPIVDALILNEKDNFAALLGKGRAYLARWQESLKGQGP